MRKPLSDRTLDNIVYTTVVVGMIAFAAIDTHYTEKNITKYNKIFLKEANKLPTKQDSIYFYQNHNLRDYLIYENPFDTTKTFKEHIRLLKVPYEEIRKIAKEKK